MNSFAPPGGIPSCRLQPRSPTSAAMEGARPVALLLILLDFLVACSCSCTFSTPALFHHQVAGLPASGLGEVVQVLPLPARQQGPQVLDVVLHFLK